MHTILRFIIHSPSRCIKMGSYKTMLPSASLVHTYAYACIGLCVYVYIQTEIPYDSTCVFVYICTHASTDHESNIATLSYYICVNTIYQ